MKKLTTLLKTLMLMSSALWTDEKITVSANSSDISEGLDLTVVAKLFAEAKNLEEFETMLNNPDSAFCNLDLNGDGQVDYLRVIETGEGNKRLIVLQAILAKDIYQDVASIYVEKDEANNVSVQVIGDEYVYGVNYIIEPVYVYRPLIYDWFWSPYWYAWSSPWYWGYYPSWWYVHSCWAHDWYWHHCYAFHHHHHYCSFRPGHVVHSGYHELHSGVTRREYAAAHPDRSFSQRNSGMSNAREIRNTTGVRTRQEAFSGGARSSSDNSMNRLEGRQPVSNRTYGSTNTAASRSQAVTRSTNATATRPTSAQPASRSQAVSRSTSATATRSTSSTTTRSTSATATRSTSAQPVSRSTSSSSTATRSTGTATRSTSSSTTSRAPQQRTSSSSSSSSYSGSRSSGSSSGSTRSSGGYSGSSSRSGGGGYSGGGSRGGGSTSGGGGGSRRR